MVDFFKKRWVNGKNAGEMMSNRGKRTWNFCMDYSSVSLGQCRTVTVPTCKKKISQKTPPSNLLRYCEFLSLLLRTVWVKQQLRTFGGEKSIGPHYGIDALETAGKRHFIMSASDLLGSCSPVLIMQLRYLSHTPAHVWYISPSPLFSGCWRVHQSSCYAQALFLPWFGFVSMCVRRILSGWNQGMISVVIWQWPKISPANTLQWHLIYKCV